MPPGFTNISKDLRGVSSFVFKRDSQVESFFGVKKRSDFSRLIVLS